MEVSTGLLIVGAGPFGLSLAAMAKHLGLDFIVAGDPLAFWRDNMPQGMLLRSGDDWHLDPAGDASLGRFLRDRGRPPGSKQPISRDEYLAYAEWFQAEKALEPQPFWIERLDADDLGDFRATTRDGDVIT